MKLYYDLHIHSALSPCGDEDMTPNNIVNMAHLKGLDIISVTDHNSCGNVRAVIKAAEGKIKVIPGMEINTREEVHVLAYFPTLEKAEDMERLIKKELIKVKNDPDIFGRQLIMDENDEIVGEEEMLLVNAVNLDIYEIQKEVKERGGIFVPAHIDRSSYSVLSNLGFLPPDLEIDGIEITEKNFSDLSAMYDRYPLFSSSDAHYLEDIAEKSRFIDITDKMTKNAKQICVIFSE